MLDRRVVGRDVVDRERPEDEAVAGERSGVDQRFSDPRSVVRGSG
jgi:hypothetical protein